MLRPVPSLSSARVSRWLTVPLALAALTASSLVAIPIGPVPLTLQTLAVTLCGVLLGPAAGAMTVAAWVVAGFSGLPLFAFGNAGAPALLGPTAGFLWSFPLVAALAGRLAGRGGLIRVFAAMLVAHLVCLAVGTAWLGLVTALPWQRALAAGFWPFLSGSLLKSALGALAVSAMARR